MWGLSLEEFISAGVLAVVFFFFFVVDRTRRHSKVKMNEQRPSLLRPALYCSVQREPSRIDEFLFAVSFWHSTAINQPNRRLISMSLENDSFHQTVIFIIDILYSLLLYLLSSFFHSVNTITMFNHSKEGIVIFRDRC